MLGILYDLLLLMYTGLLNPLCVIYHRGLYDIQQTNAHRYYIMNFVTSSLTNVNTMFYTLLAPFFSFCKQIPT